MAFDMLDAIVTVVNPTNNEKLKIRIGISIEFEDYRDHRFVFIQVVIVVRSLLVLLE